MYELYKEVWQQLRMEREVCSEIDRESTPVLCFGDWKKATVATAGLNPSEREFRDGAIPRRGLSQRFLHWPSDGELTPDRLAEAFRRSEGYFLLGNVYSQWFGNYSSFLDGLGVSFSDGSACHTDYLSPFATSTGIGDCSEGIQTRLQEYGSRIWFKILSKIPNLKVVVGHGRGHAIIPNLFGFDTWDSITLPFEVKTRGGICSLLTKEVTLGERKMMVFWWKPNLSGIPLSLLSNERKMELGKIVRKKLSFP